ncbi:MAG: T9SS type A sorting domain-containing protein [Flavobacteriales bacterium]|nr:T9SS type A sorting domain-containing protein [Flavobacteriales bacterium]
MKRAIPLITLIFLAFHTFSQTWKQTYGPYSLENNTAILQAAIVPRVKLLDSAQFTILGTARITAQNRKVQLVTADRSGNFLKRDTLFDTHPSTFGIDIVKLDSTYFVLGMIWDNAQFRPDMMIYELDQNYDTIRTIDHYEFFNLGESPMGLFRESDSTLILTGATFSGTFPFLSTHTLIAKMNFDGDTLWTKTLPNDGALARVIRTLDGNYLGVGTGNGGISGNYNILMVKFDTHGHILWEKEMNYSKEDLAVDVRQRPDSSFFMVGSTYIPGGRSSDVFFFNLSKDGDSLNFTTIGTEYKDQGIYLQENIEGNYLAVWGNFDTNSTIFQVLNPHHSYISMFSPNGDSIYTNTLTDSGSFLTSYFYNTVDSALFLCGTDSADQLLLLREDTLPKLTMNPDSVFPGDANNDGVANMLDFLTIGQHFGQKGFSRASSSILWVGQPSINWFDTIHNGQNMKHVDCDGNGIIDFVDTTAVLFNYSLTHNKTGELFSNFSTINPPISVEAITDTSGTGDDAGITIKIGDLSTVVDSAYGISISLSFQDDMIQDGSFGIDASSSWLGDPNTNMMTAVYEHTGSGQVDIGLTRYDLQNVAGHGPVFDLIFKVEDQLPNGDTAGVVVFDLVNIDIKTVVDTGVAVSIDSANWDSVNVKDDPIVVGTQMNSHFDFRIWPNPSNDYINIFSNSRNNQEIQILNLLGKSVYATQNTKDLERIDISGFESGTYFIKISEDQNLLKTVLLIKK